MKQESCMTRTFVTIPISWHELVVAILFGRISLLCALSVLMIVALNPSSFPKLSAWLIAIFSIAAIFQTFAILFFRFDCWNVVVDESGFWIEAVQFGRNTRFFFKHSQFRSLELKRSCLILSLEDKRETIMMGCSRIDCDEAKRFLESFLSTP